MNVLYHKTRPRTAVRDRFLANLLGHARKIIDSKVAVLHPLREMHPHDALCVHGGRGKFVPIGRFDVFKPNIGQRQPMLAKPEWGEESLEIAFRLPLFSRCRLPIPFSRAKYYPFSLMVWDKGINRVGEERLPYHTTKRAGCWHFAVSAV